MNDNNQTIEQHIISKIAEGYNFDSVWEIDANNYLTNEFKRRRPSRSPPRSPPRSPSESARIYEAISVKKRISVKKPISILINKNKVLIYLRKHIKFHLLFVAVYLVLSSIYIYILVTRNK